MALSSAAKRTIWIAAAVCAVVAIAVVGVSVFTILAQHRATGAVDIDPKLYPVVGIDISAHNGAVDFNRLSADSVDFVIIKATEGVTFKDTRFHDYYHAARRAGIKCVGAYHFFRFDNDGTMQALNFINSLRGKPLDLPAVIDIEEWSNPDDVATPLVVSRLADMIDCLKANGFSVMLYTNKDGYQHFVRGYFDSEPLWICSFTNPPLDGPSANRWILWQYSHKGRTPASRQAVDLNTFNGSRQSWLQWLDSIKSS